MMKVIICIAVAAFIQDQAAEKVKVPVGDLELIPDKEDSFKETEVFFQSDLYSVNLTQSEIDSRGSVIGKYYKVNKENIRLVEENKKIRKQIEKLEKNIVNEISKLNKARLSDKRILEKLAGEAEQAAGLKNKDKLANFLQVGQSKPAEKKEGNGFLYVAGLIALFVFIDLLKNWAKHETDSGYNESFKILIQRFSIFSLISSLLITANQLISFKIKNIILGCCLFSVFWLCLSFWLLVAWKSISVNWEKSEDELCKGEINEKNREFGLMRRLFVSNPFLPIFTERALRPDFNFSEYLKRCLGNTLTSIFSLSPVSFVFLVFFIVFWRFAVFYKTEFYALFAFPVFLFLLSLLCVLKSQNIRRKLIPKEGDDIKVLYDYKSDTDIPLPIYLKSRVPGPRSGLRIFSVYSLKLTCSYIFRKKYPSRHELLFWFDSYGVNFMISLMQFVIVSLGLWVVAVALYVPLPGYLNIYFFAITTFFNIVHVVWVFPIWIKSFTIISNIEMMKNITIINEVVETTKANRTYRNWRILTYFQSLWQDALIEQQSERLLKLSPGLMKLLEESFFLTSVKKKIHYKEVKEFLNKVGVVMDNDQFRLFLKDCEMDNRDLISFKGLTKGIKRLKSRKNISPSSIISHVLISYFQKDLISLTEISSFFDKNRWFLQDTDIHDFLVDLHFNLNSKNLVEIDEINLGVN